MAGGSVTCWLDEVKRGDTDAAQQLWNRYFTRLVALARLRLRGVHGVSDEEDVAIGTMKSMLMGIEQNRFPQLNDRTGLWPLLVTIVARKAQTQLRWHYAQCRSPRVETPHADFSSIAADQPSPEFALEVADQVDHLVRQLDDPTYRMLARYKLEGCTNMEIAQKMSLSTFAVYRKLGIMRRQWSESP